MYIYIYVHILKIIILVSGVGCTIMSKAVYVLGTQLDSQHDHPRILRCSRNKARDFETKLVKNMLIWDFPSY